MKIIFPVLLLIPSLLASPGFAISTVDTHRIADIHGSSRASPLAGQILAVEGIVTLVQGRGFWIQDHGSDQPQRRSGLYVETGALTTVAPGDRVRVHGEVVDWRDANRLRDLALPRLVASEIETLASRQPLPEAIAIGPGGLSIPRRLAADDLAGPLEPDQNAIDFWTSLYGMRVTLTDNQVIEPSNRFGQTWVVADSQHRHLNQYGVLVVRPDDPNVDRVLVQANEFLQGRVPDFADIGDRFATVTGVAHYERGNFRIHVDHALNRIADEQPPGRSDLSGGPAHLLVASYNIENINAHVEAPGRVASTGNIDDAIGSGRMDRLGMQIVHALNSPDIIALQEIQDDDGAELSDVVTAERTLAALAESIRRAGGPDYAWLDHPPVESGATGGQPGGNIRNAWLYNPARVRLDQDSVRVLDDPAFAGSRPSTLAAFHFNGHRISIINNHLSSKWGSSPTFGLQPRIEAGTDERMAQARFLRTLVGEIVAGQSGADEPPVIVIGDFNDHWFSEPLSVLTADEPPQLFNLIETLPEALRWTLIFEGNGQAIDHLLVNTPLRERAEFEIVYLNERFARQESDHEALLARFYLPPLN